MTSNQALSEPLHDPNAPPELEVDVLVEDGITVVVAAGEIDLSTLERYEACLAHALAGDRPVLLDLCDVFFMDSTGLRATLGARARLSAAGRSLTLACRAGAAVARLLDVSGTAELLAPQPSREAALRVLARA